ncbi:MAG TPA: hypothetical protein VFT69_09935 [Pseudolabrys sp.]|jgi:hypothetical protein|nr:hypothetical protein [Pseudolabrys sp.]
MPVLVMSAQGKRLRRLGAAMPLRQADLSLAISPTAAYDVFNRNVMSFFTRPYPALGEIVIPSRSVTAGLLHG